MEIIWLQLTKIIKINLWIYYFKHKFVIKWESTGCGLRNSLKLRMHLTKKYYLYILIISYQSIRTIKIKKITSYNSPNIKAKVGVFNAKSQIKYVQSVKKKKSPLFILIQIIVEKWNLYQSTWITVYFNFML